MQMILNLLFWLSFFALLHTYLLYPFILRIIARSRESGKTSIDHSSYALPRLSVIMSVYNEEKVIVNKIRSVFTTTYPTEKIQFIIGSDGSTDNTNKLIEDCISAYPGLEFISFSNRQGKGNVLNQLKEKATGEVFVLTDAKALFTPETLIQLAGNFQTPEVGIAGGNLVNLHTSSDGISIQESLFMFMELEIKRQEGIAWGTMIGAYGACYAIRAHLFPRIPSNFLVEDFYVTMKVLEQSKKAILNPEAIAYLNVPNEPGEEFRRKVRIAKGNYQNLNEFWHLLWPPFSGLAFSYFSHKVLRWLGPFFILLCFSTSIALSVRSNFFVFLLALQTVMFIIPFADLILRKFNKHMLILRFVTHFLSMNAALLVGFVQYLQGIKTNTWEPTRRD